MEEERVKTLLWLNKSMNPYRGSCLYNFAPEYESKDRVVWVKTYNTFVKWIEENGLPDMIGLDRHSGEEVAEWVVSYCLDNGLDMCEWVVESKDQLDEQKISEILKSIDK